MVGCGYSGGKPRHWVMMREVVSLDMLVVMGEVTACVGGGTKEVQNGLQKENSEHAVTHIHQDENVVYGC